MDSMWVENTLVPALIAAAVLLLVLWPTRHSGRRLLRCWGIPTPTEPQVDEALRYLRQRRFLYVALFVVLPPVSGLVWPAVDNNRTPADLFVPLLVAMLVAELVATLRPVSGIRSASLDPRSWRDLVPTWAVVAFAVLAGLVVALAAVGLAAQPWADRFAAGLPVDGTRRAGDGPAYAPDYRAEIATSTSWLVLGGAALCLLVVATLVHLAVRRPSVSDETVDAALRTRTARVAVAIGLGWLGASVLEANSRLDFLAGIFGPGQRLPPPGWLTGGLTQVTGVVGLVAIVGAIVCWMWLAMPSRKSLARSR